MDNWRKFLHKVRQSCQWDYSDFRQWRTWTLSTFNPSRLYIPSSGGSEILNGGTGILVFIKCLLLLLLLLTPAMDGGDWKRGTWQLETLIIAVKTQDLTTEERMAGVKNAGSDNQGTNSRGEKREPWQRENQSQGLKMQDLTAWEQICGQRH